MQMLALSVHVFESSAVWIEATYTNAYLKIRNWINKDASDVHILCDEWYMHKSFCYVHDFF